MKRYFNKKLAVTKMDIKSFKNSTKYWIYDNTYVDCDVKEIIVISLENM